MAMMLFNNYLKRFGLTKCGAACKVGLLLGLSSKTIRKWRKDFVFGKGQFKEYKGGKYMRYVVLSDEEYWDQVLKLIRQNSYSK